MRVFFFLNQTLPSITERHNKAYKLSICGAQFFHSGGWVLQVSTTEMWLSSLYEREKSSTWILRVVKNRTRCGSLGVQRSCTLPLINSYCLNVICIKICKTAVHGMDSCVYCADINQCQSFGALSCCSCVSVVVGVSERKNRKTESWNRFPVGKRKNKLILF